MKNNSSTPTPRWRWTDLLAEAVKTPGVLLTAYSRFHGYSLGNQLAALIQCKERGLQPGPLASFRGWEKLGRWVKKGQKALVLCMPVTVKVKPEEKPETPETSTEPAEPEKPGLKTVFVWRPNWFVFAQTDGEELAEAQVPGWDKTRALEALGVTEVPFDEVDGNIQGYAVDKKIAINPLAEAPVKTLFHELTHAILHTGTTGTPDTKDLPRSLREVEAEGTALLCLDALNLPGAEFCRGYIQHWYPGSTIPEASAGRIFRAADAILRASREGTLPNHSETAVAA